MAICKVCGFRKRKEGHDFGVEHKTRNIADSNKKDVQKERRLYQSIQHRKKLLNELDSLPDMISS